MSVHILKVSHDIRGNNHIFRANNLLVAFIRAAGPCELHPPQVFSSSCNLLRPPYAFDLKLEWFVGFDLLVPYAACPLDPRILYGVDVFLEVRPRR